MDSLSMISHLNNTNYSTRLFIDIRYGILVIEIGRIRLSMDTRLPRRRDFLSFQNFPNRFQQRTDAFSPTWRFLILPYFFCIAWSSSQSRLRVSIEKASNDVARLNAEEGLFIISNPKTNSKSQLPTDNLRKHRLSVFFIKRWLHTHHNPIHSST